MLTQHIALVPEAEPRSAARAAPAETAFLAELLRVSAALQRQVSHDLGPLWGVQATVNVFAALEEVPVGYWPIIVRAGELGTDAGVYLDEHGQPYARIEQGPLWSLAASRACLEMLVNPFGDRTVSAASPRAGQGTVQILVEVCAACAAPEFAYAINGVLVSDFVLPAFFSGSSLGANERLSFRHHVSRALEPQAGGHITWFEPMSNLWWLRRQAEGAPTDITLGPVDRRLTSARAQVQFHLASLLEPALPARLEREAESALERAQGAARARAQRLRALLNVGSQFVSSEPAEHADAQAEAVTTTRPAPAPREDKVVAAVAAAEPEEVSEHDVSDADEEAFEFAQEGAEHVEDVEPAEQAAHEATEEDVSEQDVSEQELAAAVDTVSYDPESDLLTDTMPPPAEPVVKPVPPLPSVPPPPRVKPAVAQLSALAERKDSPRGGAFGAGIVLAAAAAIAWFVTSSPKEAEPAKSADAPAAAAAPQALPAATPPAAPAPQAPLPSSSGNAARPDPAGQPGNAAQAAQPAATAAAAHPATPAPSPAPQVAKLESPPERRHTHRARAAAETVGQPPPAVANAPSAPSASPAASKPTDTQDAPGALNPKPASPAHAAAGLDDLIESRQ
ncbi:MAG: hypothetical protein QM778_10610 [Myxococcales bacterium]